MQSLVRAPGRHSGMTAFLALALALALAPMARAAFPIEDMSSRTLGLQYGLAFRGQNITSALVASHETIHTLVLGYSPLPYAAVEGGVGLDRLVVSESPRYAGFRGDYGFSPTLGLILSSPYLLDWVRITAGARALYLNSNNARGYGYSGWIHSPFLSAILSPSGFFDFETGMRGHYMDGTLRGPGGVRNAFTNQEVLRGFFAFTVKSPRDRAFLTVDFDVSPGLDGDWAQGPREAQVGVSFGALLDWKRSQGGDGDSSSYFPDFPSLRERLKKMAGEVE